MLSLQLKSGEYLTIGDEIAVQIFEESGSTFRVAVKAPREIPILRGEVLERTGERPGGLREKRPKSPSAQAHTKSSQQMLKRHIPLSFCGKGYQNKKYKICKTY